MEIVEVLPKKKHACFPFLEAQIDVYKPKKILCVGDVAFTAITKRDKNELKEAIWDKRTYYYKGIKCYLLSSWIYTF